MVGVTNMLCRCGNQIIFQPVRGSYFCLACGMRYCIYDVEDAFWIDDDGIDEEEVEVDVGYPPEDI